MYSAGLQYKNFFLGFQRAFRNGRFGWKWSHLKSIPKSIHWWTWLCHTHAYPGELRPLLGVVVPCDSLNFLLCNRHARRRKWARSANRSKRRLRKFLPPTSLAFNGDPSLNLGLHSRDIAQKSKVVFYYSLKILNEFLHVSCSFK